MKKLALTLLSSLVLAACGSGGGGSNTDTTTSRPAVNQPAPPFVKPTVSQPTTPKTALDSVDSAFRSQVIQEKLIELPNQQTNFAFEPEGWISVENVGNELKLRAYNLPYSAIGYVLPRNVSIDEYGRVIDNRVTTKDNFDIVGLTTKFDDIANLSAATYNGVSFGANSEGKIRFTVDFANKNVEGRLYDRTTLKDKKALPEITLEKGTIMSADSIASFGGMAHATIDGMQVHTPYAGTFMGPKAEEVNGVVLDDRGNPYEAFAGKK